MARAYNEAPENVWSSKTEDMISIFVGSRAITIPEDMIESVIDHLREMYHPEIKLMDGNPQSAEEVFELFPALDDSLGEYEEKCKYCSRGIMCRDAAHVVVDGVIDELVDVITLYIYREGMWLRPREEIISEIAKKLEKK